MTPNPSFYTSNFNFCVQMGINGPLYREICQLPSLITCHSSLEVFRSPEVVHFIHKKYVRAFPMKSKEADWATRHHFDVILMSGALQAKSLGWLSLKIVPLDSQCISNATSAPRCRPRLLFLYLYSINGASSFVRFLLYPELQRIWSWNFGFAIRKIWAFIWYFKKYYFRLSPGGWECDQHKVL